MCLKEKVEKLSNVEDTIAQTLIKKNDYSITFVQIPPPPNYSTKFKMLKKIMKLLDIQQYKKFTVSIRSFKKSWFGMIIHISKVRKGVQDLSEKLWQCERRSLTP